MLHLYTTIERIEDDEPAEIEVRVLFSFDQTPYELDICFEGASIEDKYYSGPKLKPLEIAQLQRWLYTVAYEDAQILAREEIASNYQTE